LSIQSSEDSDSDETKIADNEIPPRSPHVVTRSGRTSRFPRKFNDFIAIPAIVDQIFCDEYYAFTASNDPDVLYMKEAMAADDSKQFVSAMQEEVQAHVRDKNWVVIHKSSVPNDQKILPAVWDFHCKRDIVTRKIYKWKARLSLHGGKQIKGLDYWETYAPVASWPSIRLIMYIAVLNNRPTMQLDFF
jgi:Reverse transcriptase (RNA-dependent DNA polymerase)